MNVNTWIGIGIPFAGTALGAMCVFLLKKELNATVQKAMLGFAAGVMVGASCPICIWTAGNRKE